MWIEEIRHMKENNKFKAFRWTHYFLNVPNINVKIKVQLFIRN